MSWSSSPLSLGRCLVLISVLLAAGSAAAETAVMVSIKPLHSLVGGVMAGAGSPGLLLADGGSPHAYSLKPSQARALQKARVVFWIGPAMEGFLTKPLQTLAAKARIVELGKVDGLRRLPLRRDTGREDDHKSDRGKDHDKDHDDDHGHGHHKDHGHGAFDPHLWLDPDNAKVMVRAIARVLAGINPGRAALYAANARTLTGRLDALSSDIGERLAPVRNRPFIVFHDAYRYFETRFALTALAAVTVNPDLSPGARHVSRLRRTLQDAKAACVFSEPQFPPRLATRLTEGTGARLGVLDPLGAGLPAGPDLYFSLLRAMAASLRDCLSPRN